MKIIVEIYTCECGKDIIVIENGEDASSEDMRCPICGGPMVSEMTREIEINRVSL